MLQFHGVNMCPTHYKTIEIVIGTQRSIKFNCKICSIIAPNKFKSKQWYSNNKSIGNTKSIKGLDTNTMYREEGLWLMSVTVWNLAIPFSNFKKGGLFCRNNARDCESSHAVRFLLCQWPTLMYLVNDSGITRTFIFPTLWSVLI